MALPFGYPEIPPNPTNRDVILEIRARDHDTREFFKEQMRELRTEYEGALANVGEEYGRRIEELERTVKALRRQTQANGSTDHGT